MPTLQTRKLNITRLNSWPRSHNCNCRASIEPRQSGFNHCSYACNIPVTSAIANIRVGLVPIYPAKDRSHWLPSYSTKSLSYSMTLWRFGFLNWLFPVWVAMPVLGFALLTVKSLLLLQSGFPNVLLASSESLFLLSFWISESLYFLFLSPNWLFLLCPMTSFLLLVRLLLLFFSRTYSLDGQIVTHNVLVVPQKISSFPLACSVSRNQLVSPRRSIFGHRNQSGDGQYHGGNFLRALSPLAASRYSFIKVGKYIAHLQYCDKHTQTPKHWKELEKSLDISTSILSQGLQCRRAMVFSLRILFNKNHLPFKKFFFCLTWVPSIAFKSIYSPSALNRDEELIVVICVVNSKHSLPQAEQFHFLHIVSQVLLPSSVSCRGHWVVWGSPLSCNSLHTYSCTAVS